jgi:DNA-binding HxlR family transcriptional regulator
MTLPRDYAGQSCSLARALEIVGERWSLLIVRDAFFGVRRFSDFAVHLEIPRGVLSDRLGSLVADGVLARTPPEEGREYALTEKGLRLWPVVRSLILWGDEHYAPRGPRRLMRHVHCDEPLDQEGRCPCCGDLPGPGEIEISPGPGLDSAVADSDPIERALSVPHRLLEPLRQESASVDD